MVDEANNEKSIKRNFWLISLFHYLVRTDSVCYLKCSKGRWLFSEWLKETSHVVWYSSIYCFHENITILILFYFIRQEALLAAISEKDANIALLELSASKKKKTQDEVMALKREKDRLVHQLKQQVGRLYFSYFHSNGKLALIFICTVLCWCPFGSVQARSDTCQQLHEVGCVPFKCLLLLWSC